MKRGKLYGTTIDGGANGAGVIYKLTLDRTAAGMERRHLVWGAGVSCQPR